MHPPRAVTPARGRRPAAAVIAFLIALNGCSDDVACVAEPQPAIVVTIRDAGSGVPIATGATVRLRSITFLETFTFSPDGLTIATYAPAEIYAVTVSKPGYAPWQDRVRVEQANDCFVGVVPITALLRSE